MSDYEDRSSERRAPKPTPTPKISYGPTRGYLILIIIGIIVLMVGMIVYTSNGFLDDPDEYDEKDNEEYDDNVRTIRTIGYLIQYIGLILFSIGIIYGALKDNDLPHYVRLGMLIALGIILGFF
jgi:hypothetical protein